MFIERFIDYLSESPWIFFVIAAFIVIAVTIIGKIPWSPPIIHLYRKQRISFAIVGAFLIGISILGTGCSSPSPTSISSGNLIPQSSVVPVFVPEQSSANLVGYNPSSSTIHHTFTNTTNGTGLALKFTTPLNVTPYHSIVIKGTSTKTFSFEIQYKKTSVGQLTIVEQSTSQSFAATSQETAISVPITFSGSIDEIVFNNLIVGHSSDVTINSIELVA